MKEEIRKRARILLIDDEPQNVRYLEDVLAWAGYENLESTTDPNQAVRLFSSVDPDLVVLDLLMPGKDGFAILDEVRKLLDEDAYLPILVLTSDGSRETKRRAMAAGARDFLTKPMSPTEVRLRVDNLLEARFLYRRCRSLQDSAAVGEAVTEGGDRVELLERWAGSIERLTGGDGQHAKRVSWMSGKLAGALGLPEEEVTLIQEAALLHDLGKIALPRRPAAEADADGNGSAARSGAPLSAEAFREHPNVGAELLAGSRSPVLRLAAEIAGAHHENWNGSGYPSGLAAEEIPLAARIVAVADWFDHLTYDEAEALTTAEAVEWVEREAGGRFDPAVVEALAAVQVARHA